MNQNPNRLQYISTSQQTVPGLKVAYGSNAAANPFQDLEVQGERKSFLSKLKNAVLNLVTEEAENDRPIGISQLSRNTFKASEEFAGRTIVRSGRAIQDYRFNQLVEPKR